jgi:hypothetical protein
MELYLFFAYTAAAVLVIGGLDSIRIAYKVFVKHGAFNNFIESQIMGFIFGCLRLLPYGLILIVLLTASVYLEPAQ